MYILQHCSTLNRLQTEDFRVHFTQSYANLVIFTKSRMLNSNKKGDQSSRAMIYKFTCTAVSIFFFCTFSERNLYISTTDSDGASKWSPSHTLAPMLVLLVCHAHSCLTRMRAFQQQWCLSDCGSWSEIPRSLVLPCWHGYISVSSSLSWFM